MLKTDSLREAMTRSCRWCQANPEKFTIFVESGNIETTGETPSFVYRYQMVMFVCGNAFASRAAVRARRRQNTCRSQNPACHLPKATGRIYSRM